VVFLEVENGGSGGFVSGRGRRLRLGSGASAAPSGSGKLGMEPADLRLSQSIQPVKLLHYSSS